MGLEMVQIENMYAIAMGTVRELHIKINCQTAFQTPLRLNM